MKLGQKVDGAQRVPVRIQIWHDGVRLDVRAWLDEFTLTNDIQPLEPPSSFLFRGVQHDVSVTAHTDADTPWKFHRGKPVAA